MYSTAEHQNTLFTKKYIANTWTGTKKTEFRICQSYQQTCWSNCRYWVSTTTPNIVSIIQINHDEHIGLRRQKETVKNKRFFYQHVKTSVSK